MSISSLGRTFPLPAPTAVQAKPRPEQAASPSRSEPSDQVQLSGAPPADTPSEGISRREIPGSYIVIAPTNQLNALGELQGVKVDRVLGQVGDSSFVLVDQPDKDLQQMRRLGDDFKVMPNYEYSGKLFDEPVSQGPAPEAARPGHLDIMNIGPAWEKTKGSPSVLAAITDTGLDIAHGKLQGTVWTNPDEIAGNGIDDDGNGYVDDTIGWDVSDNDNDPSDTRSTHHTHVHGIVHAQEGDGKVAGVAPGTKSMAMRISGGKRGYNTAVVVESYLYALLEGAKSINTSFNIDGFVGDEAIESTYRALGDNDVLLFNSAGNSGRLNSPRSKFEDVVLVASTDTAAKDQDKRSSFSNYGNGVDIAAPGRDIVATLPRDRDGAMSGTSMASPNAMGVDLLVRSAHPEWNREQRWAQIAGTADNIDAVNPGIEGLLGAGRVNAGRALTETLPPPTLSAREVRDAGGDLSKVVVRLDKVLDTTSANREEAWRILDSEGEVVRQGAPKEVRLLTNELQFDVSDLAPGSYQLVGSAEHLHDPFHQPLDGNGDGVGGDDFVKRFQV